MRRNVNFGQVITVFKWGGVLLVLLAALAAAGVFVWYKSRYDTATIYAYMLIGGGACLLPFIDFAPEKTPEAWICMAALGVLTTYAAYVALARSLRRINQVEAAVVGNIER